LKKVAVIGYGGMGQWHCSHILKSDVVSLVGISDIDPKERELARSRGIFVYENNEAVFADKNVDIIVVAIPNDAHEQVTVKALESGHHTICEKPVALSLESFDRMVAAQKAQNKLLTVHQNRRWDKEFIAVKEVVDSGELGDAIRLESRVHGSRGIPGDWRMKKECGGGMLYDWGVHIIDQALKLFPYKIVEIDCRLTHITYDEVDDGVFLEITFENGITAHIEVGTYNFVKLPRFYLQCRGGSAVMRDWNCDLEIVKMNKWQEKDVKPVETSAGLSKTLAPRDGVSTENYTYPLKPSDPHDFYRDFCAAIDGKKPQEVQNKEVRRVLEVMHTAFESDRLGQRIKTNI